MTKEECRVCAQRRIPVVLRETGTVPEIVYPSIREIKVIYASERERAAGYPPERLAVLLADRCGHSFTEVLPRQLRLPSEDEAMGAVPEEWTMDEVDEMLEARRYLEDKAEREAGEAEVRAKREFHEFAGGEPRAEREEEKGRAEPGERGGR